MFKKKESIERECICHGHAEGYFRSDRNVLKLDLMIVAQLHKLLKIIKLYI